MPHTIIKLWPGKTEDEKKLLAERITKVIVETIGSKESSISIAIEEVASEKWAQEVYKKDILEKEGTLYKKPGYEMDIEG